MNFTEKQKKAVLEACSYYLFAATHHSDGIAGLHEEDRYYKELREVRRKIQSVLKVT